MKTTKRRSYSDDQMVDSFVKAMTDFIANSAKAQEVADEKARQERERAARERDRQVIARLCRQKRYRKKYETLGLWPLQAA
uniref:hypothetical protein n=1 Tax=uncultured Rhizobium sp. TaxID=155567 RepID=UPI00262B591A|nr:hypothetical protein [uncultured Rhizobium sp.]